MHWFGHATDIPSGFAARHLPKVSFLHKDDPDAFRFLNPNDVIRGVHLIPSFRMGMMAELLSKPSFVIDKRDEEEDWNYYDVNM